MAEERERVEQADVDATYQRLLYVWDTLRSQLKQLGRIEKLDGKWRIDKARSTIEALDVLVHPPKKPKV